ncbi:DUF445 domain-containing protein [Acetobacter sp. AN02]|uniref:DUF445 domain-containing protein n=1 Tax=Acetobacter sp. AN02 TaxID=2894186 RepID=UPI0024346329|nr:DUF445 domain-containing protein [Acetobacter sp. AN02]MDG6094856.1 DUF445 domain-containing protein [Acetobacter sp. AN02]
MTVPTDPDIQARQALARQKTLATGLLGGMAGLTLLTYLPLFRGLEPAAHMALETVRAGGKAGVVGGIADWFAVTALFRHPLGLPIPHTAIIPAQKERMGRALARFVAAQVFTEKEIGRALEGIDLPGILAGILEDPATMAGLTRAVLGTIPGGLERLEDGRASAAFARTLPVILGGNTLAPLMARGLRALVDGDCHQDVLSFMLGQLQHVLQSRESALRQMIEERVREQGGRFVGWAIGGSIATKVLEAAREELDRIDPKDSALREGFTRWVRGEIERMETDPERAGEISSAMRGVFAHESVLIWGGDIWQRLRGVIEADIAQPDGWAAGMVQDSVRRIAVQLRTDSGMRARVTDMTWRLVVRVLPYAREKMEGFITRVVSGWDGAALADKTELRVGRDLQYVRVNGTLVGFIVGAALSVGLSLLFGAGA